MERRGQEQDGDRNTQTSRNDLIQERGPKEKVKVVLGLNLYTDERCMLIKNSLMPAKTEGRRRERG